MSDDAAADKNELQAAPQPGSTDGELNLDSDAIGLEEAPQSEKGSETPSGFERKKREELGGDNQVKTGRTPTKGGKADEPAAPADPLAKLRAEATKAVADCEEELRLLNRAIRDLKEDFADVDDSSFTIPAIAADEWCDAIAKASKVGAIRDIGDDADKAKVKIAAEKAKVAALRAKCEQKPASKGRKAASGLWSVVKWPFTHLGTILIIIIVLIALRVFGPYIPSAAAWLFNWNSSPAAATSADHKSTEGKPDSATVALQKSLKDAQDELANTRKQLEQQKNQVAEEAAAATARRTVADEAMKLQQKAEGFNLKLAELRKAYGENHPQINAVANLSLAGKGEIPPVSVIRGWQLDLGKLTHPELNKRLERVKEVFQVYSDHLDALAALQEKLAASK